MGWRGLLLMLTSQWSPLLGSPPHVTATCLEAGLVPFGPKAERVHFRHGAAVNWYWKSKSGVRTKKNGESAFSVYVHSLWNSLPESESLRGGESGDFCSKPAWIRNSCNHIQYVHASLHVFTPDLTNTVTIFGTTCYDELPDTIMDGFWSFFSSQKQIVHVHALKNKLSLAPVGDHGCEFV